MRYACAHTFLKPRTHHLKHSDSTSKRVSCPYIRTQHHGKKMAFEALGQEIYANLDLIWIPIAILSVHEGQRVNSAVFCAFCYMSLRMQLEVLNAFDAPNGFFDLLTMDPYIRGLASYGFVTILYLLLSIFSPNTKGAVFMAASLSLYFLALSISSVIMAL